MITLNVIKNLFEFKNWCIQKIGFILKVINSSVVFLGCLKIKVSINLEQTLVVLVVFFGSRSRLRPIGKSNICAWFPQSPFFRA